MISRQSRSMRIKGKAFKELLQSSIIMKWGSLLLVFLALTACQASLKAEPADIAALNTTEAAPEPVNIPDTTHNPCLKVDCETDKECKGGVCVCLEGTKDCKGDCIPLDGCCDDSECEGHCADNQCVDACTYGEQYKDGKCVCAENYKYCDAQEKCIPQDYCCSFLNCRSFEECVPTTYTASICFQFENKKKCRLVSDLARTEYVEIGDLEISATPVLFGETNLQLRLDNETYALQPNVKIDLKGIDIWAEDLKPMGGFCREEE